MHNQILAQGLQVPNQNSIRMYNVHYAVGISEGCGHMPLMNQIRGGHMHSSKHAPDEIRNSMILPLMKKSSYGGHMGHTFSFL